METPARYVVGIDLGTTNSALAFAEPGRNRQIATLPIPQLVSEGEVGERASLPSALYLAGDHDVAPGALALPWRKDERFAVGVLARRLGERVAGRLLVSVKSWLCHDGVDRRAAILPWGGDPEVAKLSPVAASARILQHLRDAWDATHPDAPLAMQDVVLTVPASFDEVARELTTEAAREVGLTRLRLLEEPQAAMYAWIASRERDWRDALAGCRLLLVVDVGGGTTDFSLIAVHRGAGGLELERVAVGDHLLLGGDNMDLALARSIETRSKGAAKLDAARWQQLTALCRDGKEKLLAADAPEMALISLAGRGRGIISDVLRANLERGAVADVVLDGFFPMVESGDRPRTSGAMGLAEFGLPFVEDPTITRHLAAFLARQATDSNSTDSNSNDDGAAIARAAGSMAAPDAVLFNGGALTPPAIRGRVLDTLERWLGTRPLELVGSDLNLAVARGAVAYGLARCGIGVRLAGGAARSYYVEIARPAERAGVSGATSGATSGAVRALCIAPRGMQEGESLAIDQPEFEVLANAPVCFPMYASTSRAADQGGAVIEADRAALVALPPIQTVLRFGRALSQRLVAVGLETHLNESGALELWCQSRSTDHRWRLRFDLRARESNPGAEPPGGASLELEAPPEPDHQRLEELSPDTVEDAVFTTAAAPEQEGVIAEARLAAATELIGGCFGEPGAVPVDPIGLTRQLEEALDASKDAWPIAAIRTLWDQLFALQTGRGRTAAHEARWLNLAGFLLRPGFGDERDAWRAEQLWRQFERGLFFAKATQARAEWWTLWKRASGGLSRQQQQALYQEIRPLLLLDRKKAKSSRWRGGPQEVREMWQVAASLERLPAALKREMAEVLVARVVENGSGETELWALSRLAARVPTYGPANTVVEPAHIATWVGRLLSTSIEPRAQLAWAVAQMARASGDRARDLASEERCRVVAWLEASNDTASLGRIVRSPVRLSSREHARVLAESLPVGLRIRGEGGETGMHPTT